MLEVIKSFFSNDNNLIQCTGFIGKDRENWTQRTYVALLTAKEKRLLEEKFDANLDGCIIDTIAREMPAKLQPI